MNNKTKYLAHAALIAALYAVLTHLQNFLIPNSTSFAIQLRMSEALCVLALFTPAAISGLTVGCLLFNLTFAAALPLDWLAGTAATLIAALAMYALRNYRIKGYPLLSMVMPALSNAIFVGWELTVYIGGGFGINALYVALGEAAVLLTLGSLLFRILERRGLARLLFH
ncbi:MAG: QueT transporter family protein [Oscillospiraceae bacterium]|nr:QueT transporter family protein [Oscillospiraceae bacterium]